MSTWVEQWADERRREAETVSVLCAWGNCVYFVYRGRIDGGFGPIACPCDHLPGWRSDRVQGQAKPRVPALNRGRNGSRNARSARRHRLPAYLLRLGADRG